MRILVCGGREFDDWLLLCGTLDNIAFGGKVEYVTVIQGEAKGADFLGRVWAKYRNFSFKSFPADWKKYGKGAGPIRNQQMIDEGKTDLVVAFKGGYGTKDMVTRAKKHNIEVIEVG